MENPKPSDELLGTLVRDICSVEWQVRTKAEYRRRIQAYGDARVREAMEAGNTGLAFGEHPITIEDLKAPDRKI